MYLQLLGDSHASVADTCDSMGVVQKALELNGKALEIKISSWAEIKDLANLEKVLQI